MSLNIVLQPLTNMFNKVRSITINYVSDVGDRAAAQPLGQFLIQKTEDLIWSFEKSIEWSLPSEVKAVADSTDTEVEQNGQQQEKVETPRPLPWIFFIPVLIIWRCAWFSYETAVSMVGQTPIKPVDVVDFLRNQRRNLRTVRIRGKRTMTSQETSTTALSKLQSFVQQTFSRAMCFTGPDAHKEEIKTCVEMKAYTDLADKEQQQKQEVEEDTENVLDKLNRLSQEEDNIENDPDFEPSETSVSSVRSASSGSDVTEEERDDAGVTRSPFIGGDVIEEEDESSEHEESQQPLEDAYLSLSSQSQTPLTSKEDISSISTNSADIYSDLVQSHESAVHKLSNIFKKKTILTQTSN